MQMKVSLIIQIIQDSILICAEGNRFNDGVAGQLLAYKTELEIYYKDHNELINLPETLVNLLTKCNETK